MIDTPVLAAVVVTGVILGGLAVGAVSLYRRAGYRRIRAGHRNRPAGDDPSKPGATGGVGPLHCYHESCKAVGELFWQSRYGLVVLCRNHAYVLRNQLDYLLETMEPGSENK